MPSDDDFTDGPADERCEACGRLDPANCPCAPEDLTDAYASASARLDELLAMKKALDLEAAFRTTPIEDTEIYAATPETPGVVAEVADERVRQVAKWGVQSRPDGTDPIYAGLAEIAKKVTDEAAADGTLTWRKILAEEVLEASAETDPTALRAELLQVAAVAVSWVEDIDRR